MAEWEYERVVDFSFSAGEEIAVGIETIRDWMTRTGNPCPERGSDLPEGSSPFKEEQDAPTG